MLSLRRIFGIGQTAPKTRHDEVRLLIDAEASPPLIASMFYALGMGKHYLDFDPEAIRLAREYGGTLTLDQIQMFRTAVEFDTAECTGMHNRVRWHAFVTELVVGHVQAGWLDTAADAVRAAQMMGGYDRLNGYFEGLEGQLVKAALPLLREHKEVIDFSLALKTYRGVMDLCIGLGYLPDAVFNEAIAQHNLFREAEERRFNERPAI